jgi:predicted lactoylglutathione lyase
VGGAVGGRRYVAAVEQRISLLTLGVADVARSRRFYERLGWRGQEVEQTVFFQAGGMVVVLWHQDALGDDAGLGPVAPQGFRGVALAQNVRSAAEVDAVVAAAEEAGATVTRRPAQTFYGGYAGYFTDPDGHAWEIAWNPGFTIAEDGSLTLPDFGAA